MSDQEPVRRSFDLAHEVDEVKARLDHSLAELDRRRHELTNVPLQLRRHPAILFAAAGVLLVAVGGGVISLRWRRARHTPMARARRLRLALSRAVEHPELVARGELDVGQKILAAVGSAVAVTLVKAALQKVAHGA